METSNIINSINAKYLSVFGESPNKPEIKIPIDFDDFEIENLKFSGKKIIQR